MSKRKTTSKKVKVLFPNDFNIGGVIYKKGEAEISQEVYKILMDSPFADKVKIIS